MGLRAAVQETLQSLVREQEYGFCDGLRGLAMLWVCAHHAITLFVQLPAWASTGGRMLTAWWPVAPFASGEAGVDVFLVLSGFLIGGALYREASRSGRIAHGRFVLRRFFRLFPSLASTMVLTMVVAAVFGDRQTCPFHSWYMYLFLVNNNMIPEGLECVGHTWSVSLEIQLYLATVLVFLLASGVSRLSRHKALLLRGCMTAFGVVGWAACLAVRIWFLLDFALDDQGAPLHKYDFAVFYFTTPYRVSTYMAGLVVGVQIAARKEHGTTGASCSSFLANVTLAASLLLLACTCMFADNPLLFKGLMHQQIHASMIQRVRVAFSRPLLGVAVAALIFLCAEGHAPRIAGLLSRPSCRVLAGLSYSMYLMQFVGQRLVEVPYARAIATASEGMPLWLVALTAYGGVALIILGTAPLALLNYALVERPGIFVGRRCVELLSRIGRRAEDRAPSGSSKSVERREQNDLEACSNSGSAEASTVTDLPESTSADSTLSAGFGGGSGSDDPGLEGASSSA